MTTRGPVKFETLAYKSKWHHPHGMPIIRNESSIFRADIVDEWSKWTNRNGIANMIQKSNIKYRTLAGSPF